MLDQFIVVLHRPRDVRNIGAVVRAMKNMGFARLRLVIATRPQLAATPPASR